MRPRSRVLPLFACLLASPLLAPSWLAAEPTARERREAEERARRSEDAARRQEAGREAAADAPRVPAAEFAPGYRPNEGVLREAMDLARRHPSRARFEPCGRSLSGLAIGLLTLADRDPVLPDPSRRPAVLLASGIHPGDLAGGEVAIRAARLLLERAAAGDPAALGVLRSATLYILPRLDPEGGDVLFARPRRSPEGNTRPVDDDRDGEADEDPGDDLDGDGAVAWMRVEDPFGRHIADPGEPRLLREADPGKGEAGTWRLLPEGRDDDGDGRWNEDPEGAVSIARNFPAGYAWFPPRGGTHPASEPETRAFLDFWLEHPNVAVMVLTGGEDTVHEIPGADKDAGSTEPPRWDDDEDGGEAARPRDPLLTEKEDRYIRSSDPPKGVFPGDLPFFEWAAREARAALGEEEDSNGRPGAGGFAPGSACAWAYYDAGVLPVCLPAWLPPAPGKKEDHRVGAAADARQGAAGGGDRSPREEEPATGANREEKPRESAGADPLAFEKSLLAWADATSQPGVFLPWRRVEHPDFPGKTVEVGGLLPGADLPPASALDAIGGRFADLLARIAAALPRLDSPAVEARPLGAGVWRITAKVRNLGTLPTALVHGARTRRAKPVRVELDPGAATLLQGNRVTLVTILPAKGVPREITWVVRGEPGTEITVSAASEKTGAAAARVTLSGDVAPSAPGPPKPARKRPGA